MIQFFTDKRGRHRFRIKGDNGENIVVSEGYASKSNARRGVGDLKRALEGWEES